MSLTTYQNSKIIPKDGSTTPKAREYPGLRLLKKDKIAVDVDSTLYDFEEIARDSFLKLYEETENREYLKGAYHPWTEWRSPADACGIDIWMQIISMCHEPEIVESRDPFPGAVDTLCELSDEGYPLVYVSTRNTEAARATETWLKDNCFPGGEIHCTMDSKDPYIAECRYLIDDRPKTLLDFIYSPGWVGEQRKGLSLLYEYNRALTDVPDIFLAPTWSGLRSWMARKGLLNV